MATIKSYTDIEQSKKLEEILPLESADYFHAPDAGIVVTEPYKLNEDDETVITAYKGAIPCWSVGALLNVAPKDEQATVCVCFGGYQGDDYIPKWFCYFESYQDPMIYEQRFSDSLLDACFEIVVWLLENNYIKK